MLVAAVRANAAARFAYATHRATAAANTAYAAYAAAFAAYADASADFAADAVADAARAAARAESADGLVADFFADASALSSDARSPAGATAAARSYGVAPLWPIDTPGWADTAWSRLRDHLLAANEGWEVWTGWYDARLRGIAPDIDLEARRVIEPTRWDDGPAAVNAEIAAIIADHEARKEASSLAQPAMSDAAEQIEKLLDTPALATAYADFDVDAASATVRMVPMPGDIPVLVDADIALDWRSRLEGLALQPLALIEDIRDARCNVPQALLKDLARYAQEAQLGSDAVRPGVLDAYGRSLIAAGEIEDIVHALGDYLGGTLARIGEAHSRLMRDYHAQVTSRLHAAPVALPEEATPAAVADAVEAVSESLKEEPWGGLRATPDFTDLLDAQKEAFRAAAARLGLTDDANARQVILNSIAADEVSTLASVARFALRGLQHVGSRSPFGQRVGYAGSLVGLLESFMSGNVGKAIQTVLRWLGVG